MQFWNTYWSWLWASEDPTVFKIASPNWSMRMKATTSRDLHPFILLCATCYESLCQLTEQSLILHSVSVLMTLAWRTSLLPLSACWGSPAVSSMNSLFYINTTVKHLMCVCVYVSRSVVSNSLRPHGLYPTRLSLSMHFSRQEYWSGLSFPSASTSYEVIQLSFAYVRGQQIMALGLNLVYHL